MTNRIYGIVLAAVAMAVFAVNAADVQTEDPRVAVQAARTVFEKENGVIFAGAKVRAADAVPEQMRLDAPHATGVWTCVLPYAEDERVRFLDVEMKDGQFVKGTLLVFGQSPAKVDAKQFAELRAEFPMIAVQKTAVVYPKTTVKPVEKPERFAEPGISPVSRHLGALAGSAKRLGLDTSDLGYRVIFRDAQGKEIDLGVQKRDLGPEQIYPVFRDKVEEAYPEEKDRFSKSRSIPYWRSGEVIYRGE